MMRKAKRTPLDKVRAFASQVKDHRQAVMLRASIACATNEDFDIVLALGEAKDHGKHQSVTAESLTILVKFLAESGNFEKARMIVKEDMAGMDRYWHAQAWIFLAKSSGNEADKEDAKAAIGRIVNNEYHNQAGVDLDSISIEDRKTEKEEFSFVVIDRIAAVLTQLENFVDGHKISTKNNSAYLHAQVELILAMFFAEALE